MTQFNFTEKVNAPLERIESAALGVDANTKMAQADIGKGVKLAASQNFVPVAANDEIEGVVTSVEPWTVNDGFSFGGVQRDQRILATVGANQAGALAIRTLVVADTPIALGTAGLVQVKAGAPADFKWRVLRHVTGTGVAGDTVLLEKI